MSLDQVEIGRRNLTPSGSTTARLAAKILLLFAEVSKEFKVIPLLEIPYVPFSAQITGCLC